MSLAETVPLEVVVIDTKKRVVPLPAKMCGGKKRQGEGTCKLTAGYGTSHLGYGKCKFHFGSTQSNVKHAARLKIADELDELRTMGEEIPIEPTAALASVMNRSAGKIAWLELKIATLRDDELTQFTGSGEKPGVWLQMHADESERLAKFAKMALDAGVNERAVTLVEEQGRLINMLLHNVVNALELTPEQQERAPGIVRQQLLALPVAT